MKLHRSFTKTSFGITLETAERSWTIAAGFNAQTPRLYTIAVAWTRPRGCFGHYALTFRHGLTGARYVNGRPVWANIPGGLQVRP